MHAPFAVKPLRCSISTASRLLRRLQGLNGLSLVIEPGEMRAIIGPNGAGKTTMMDIITGKTRPDAGEVMFGGRRSDQARRGRDRQSRHRPQIPEADGVRKPHDRGQHPAGAEPKRTVRRTLFWIDGRPTENAHRRHPRTSSSAIDKRRLAANLSHGQKQWLEIGMLLAQDPKLLLVDEPAAGMTDARRPRRPSCSRRSPRPIRSSWSSTTWASSASSASR
jgi:urea transport system ATP-binding protein